MRRYAICLPAVLFTLALTGCRSTPTPPRDAAPAQRTASPGTDEAEVDDHTALPRAAPSNDARPLIVCFGDSLTAGFGTNPGESYPDYLQADLDAAHYAYRVDNQGISGNTTKDGVERLPGILALHAQIVVVEFGGNDGLRGLRIEDTWANLDTMVSTLEKSGAKVVLAGITLPPDYGPDYIQQFTTTYTLLAKKYHTPLLPFLLQNVFGVPGMMQRDQTHATSAGNKIVARNLLPYLTPVLKK